MSKYTETHEEASLSDDDWKQVASIEAQILDFLETTKDRAVVFSQIATRMKVKKKRFKPIAFQIKATWAGVRRLEAKHQVFRFNVDGEDYFVAWQYRKQAHVYVPLAFEKRNEHLRELHSAFGINLPSQIARTPAFNTLADDRYGESYNRYLDDFDDDGKEMPMTNEKIGIA